MAIDIMASSERRRLRNKAALIRALRNGRVALLRGDGAERARQFANSPTGPCVWRSGSGPAQLDERAFTPPIGGVRKSLEDNSLSLSPSTLSGIWGNGGVNAEVRRFSLARSLPRGG